MQPNPKKASKKSTAKALKKTELSFNMAMDIDDQQLMNAPPPASGPMENDDQFIVFKAKPNPKSKENSIVMEIVAEPVVEKKQPVREQAQANRIIEKDKQPEPERHKKPQQQVQAKLFVQQYTQPIVQPKINGKTQEPQPSHMKEVQAQEQVLPQTHVEEVQLKLQIQPQLEPTTQPQPQPQPQPEPQPEPQPQPQPQPQVYPLHQPQQKLQQQRQPYLREPIQTETNNNFHFNKIEAVGDLQPNVYIPAQQPQEFFMRRPQQEPREQQNGQKAEVEPIVSMELQGLHQQGVLKEQKQQNKQKSEQKSQQSQEKQKQTQKQQQKPKQQQKQKPKQKQKKNESKKCQTKNKNENNKTKKAKASSIKTKFNTQLDFQQEEVHIDNHQNQQLIIKQKQQLELNKLLQIQKQQNRIVADSTIIEKKQRLVEQSKRQQTKQQIQKQQKSPQQQQQKRSEIEHISQIDTTHPSQLPAQQSMQQSYQQPKQFRQQQPTNKPKLQQQFDIPTQFYEDDFKISKPITITKTNVNSNAKNGIKSTKVTKNSNKITTKAVVSGKFRVDDDLDSIVESVEVKIQPIKQKQPQVEQQVKQHPQKQLQVQVEKHIQSFKQPQTRLQSHNNAETELLQSQPQLQLQIEPQLQLQIEPQPQPKVQPQRTPTQQQPSKNQQKQAKIQVQDELDVEIPKQFTTTKKVTKNKVKQNTNNKTKTTAPVTINMKMNTKINNDIDEMQAEMEVEEIAVKQNVPSQQRPVTLSGKMFIEAKEQKVDELIEKREQLIKKLQNSYQEIIKQEQQQQKQIKMETEKSQVQEQKQEQAQVQTQAQAQVQEQKQVLKIASNIQTKKKGKKPIPKKMNLIKAKSDQFDDQIEETKVLEEKVEPKYIQKQEQQIGEDKNKEDLIPSQKNIQKKQDSFQHHQRKQINQSQAIAQQPLLDRQIPSHGGLTLKQQKVFFDQPQEDQFKEFAPKNIEQPIKQQHHNYNHDPVPVREPQPQPQPQPQIKIQTKTVEFEITEDAPPTFNIKSKAPPKQKTKAKEGKKVKKNSDAPKNYQSSLDQEFASQIEQTKPVEIPEAKIQQHKEIQIEGIRLEPKTIQPQIPIPIQRQPERQKPIPKCTSQPLSQSPISTPQPIRKKFVDQLVSIVKTTTKKNLNAMKERLLMMHEDIRSSLYERQEKEKLKVIPEVHYDHIIAENVELREQLGGSGSGSEERKERMEFI